MELNKKVIIRADRAGVFYGTISSPDHAPWGAILSAGLTTSTWMQIIRWSTSCALQRTATAVMSSGSSVRVTV